MVPDLGPSHVDQPAIAIDVGTLAVGGRTAHVVVSVSSFLARPLEVVSVKCTFFDRDHQAVAVGSGAVAYVYPGQVAYTIVGVRLDGAVPVTVQCGIR